ncbi:hypothetical protein PHYBLDRAFT_164937 [Phycomyces blakesleeanus NRRL 1555(-)]|uniref:Uncharacterized protein n=1 Tax=Phycomyces blakesleeanus (strain ATCC 8743b / DSM 1359 / FGSC 10004 / NBRC 33097 / NRRL 1555) TaxID=763407 RepID=A0A167PJA3_PHYB8|nr:hypothetical protein PHYBLDRAFT_164937 [Phycomyces blakesleeanus NRRL 1555(-)]OAD78058.1 hypothetical protein PHYBLDRAFT_164937 [Phycomyces blakesleeanus NRRL 1555(-)]|eukprot:XP_018296098.1 hypothetical protein PHYBLDRAFT_164937 [Phycomyces blakesleeanus NRRL 1555(-)]
MRHLLSTKGVIWYSQWKECRLIQECVYFNNLLMIAQLFSVGIWSGHLIQTFDIGSLFCILGFGFLILDQIYSLEIENHIAMDSIYIIVGILQLLMVVIIIVLHLKINKLMISIAQ